ncbi:endonuclease/exonuclease/phosphatase family metal-dependent hydrolase [Streptomyces sp. TLI_235]|nr:endonuclease/exonuclease/phosphatase family protein [Streptomyces sp. TLI_235]PBC75560.1 endonuclease/exonuclease/phosphatase family metal-dependent hydrolase [Streptomyces sp. TLI_235]
MSGAGTIAVATLNVCCGLRNSLRPVKERAAEICARVEQTDVDVLNLQEVWTPGLLGFLRGRLPSFPHVACSTGVFGRPMGGLVAFARVPVQSVAFRSFRATRPDRGNPLFRAGGAVTAGLQGVLTYELTGRRTILGNAHLSANRDGDWSAGNRHEALQRAQLRAVHEALRRAGRSDTRLALLVGDFNLPSTCGLYRRAVDGGAWRDPFAAADLPTFHAPLLPAGARAHRVDYVLVQGDPGRHPVTAADLLLTEPVRLPSGAASYLSDHMAQLVRVAMPAAAPDRPEATSDL